MHIKTVKLNYLINNINICFNLKIALIPHALGCIDGSSITIRTPKHKVKSTYVNRHDTPTITLQGTCDSKKRFLDAFTGPPGKLHDARVLKLSGVLDWLPKLCNENTIYWEMEPIL